ncbi:hypothetical protein ACNKHO_25670 [Shigella flexneri]
MKNRDFMRYSHQSCWRISPSTGDKGSRQPGTDCRSGRIGTPPRCIWPGRAWGAGTGR